MRCPHARHATRVLHLPYCTPTLGACTPQAHTPLGPGLLIFSSAYPYTCLGCGCTTTLCVLKCYYENRLLCRRPGFITMSAERYNEQLARKKARDLAPNNTMPPPLPPLSPLPQQFAPAHSGPTLTFACKVALTAGTIGVTNIVPPTWLLVAFAFGTW